MTKNQEKVYLGSNVISELFLESKRYLNLEIILFLLQLFDFENSILVAIFY